MNKVLKILLIGLITTICRMAGQFLIPSTSQSVLGPSFIAQSGLLPMAFTIYGILAYSAIASLYILIKDSLPFGKVLNGLAYGICCSLIWVAYLFEPLPHVAPLDRITYPLADSFALIVMGLALGLFFKVKGEKDSFKLPGVVSPLVIGGFFLIGRLVQYLALDIYSDFHSKPLETLIWVIVTGLVVGTVLSWIGVDMNQRAKASTGLVLGLCIYGIDYFFFNFFMVLVLDVDIVDLLLRTFIDIGFVTLGCLLVVNKGLLAKVETDNKKGSH